ncbi:pectate lyase [Pedobacter sp. SD-b]|uniref:Pectate lyase n=1 Tax=Pedobacter segetis TaxID=2793069 RepID=A0ABS1BJN2_9SPHI|nr:pectate lyase [Pedobacter segetis]
MTIIFLSCSAKKPTVAINDKPLAFPSAEGYGKYTTGGRGGEVFIVDNLEDSGTGSFREAATAKHPRIIVFAVSGTIHLKSELSISKNATIAGQTAPGDGICLADEPVLLGGDNIIVRFMRFRMGDRYQNKGMIDKTGADDAFGGSKKKNIIIDHCSMSWSTDEAFSVYRGDSTTLQWNLIEEPLNYSYHFEDGDKDFEHHGYGGIWGGEHFTAHHNLFAHCGSRNPRWNGARLGATEELADFRNNVIYDWGHNSAYGGEGGKYNMVANYYKYGPSTHKSVKNRIVNPSYLKEVGFGQFYVADNYVDGFPDVTKDNKLGVQLDKGFGEADMEKTIVNSPMDVMPIFTTTAIKAYGEVLKNVGATLPKRDTLDQRIINEVKTRTGRMIDVQGGFKHGTPYEISKIAWPVLKSNPALKDSDKDGMPDDWEIKNNLNPKINDSASFGINKQYTNIEIYINSLITK